ncbi:MAG: alpha-galactosidase, partial [Sphingomonas sp.]|nr:alpha-galactosidase [Sphingomonas sp.]
MDYLTLGASDCVATLEPAPGAPVWRHWGPGAAPRDLPPLGHLRPPAGFSLDEPVPLTLVPEFGTGWFGPAALHAHRDGRDFAPHWRCERIERQADALIIHLADPATALRLTQRLAFADGVLRLSATLTNEGAPLDVQWLAAGTLPLPLGAARIKSFTGHHNDEFVPHEEPMPAHEWRRETRGGLTGHGGAPGLFVLGDGAGWHQGQVHAAQLAWSGNARLIVARADTGWLLQAGEALAPGEARLAPGESYTTPELLATCSGEGLNGAIQAFHAAIRAAGPELGPRPVHLNSWEGLYFDQDEARLIALAERAAVLGVERFVLDDGWFVGRRDDRAGLGDWRVDPVKYPRGLAPLAERVRALGMDFGLWVEPEMVNPDSDLYRAHPDWVLRLPGVPALTARHQLVLDLARAEVRDHLFAALDALLRALPIAYLKWDHNRHLAPAGGADARAGYRAQTLGAYALIDRLRAAHPAIEIEACAGGGGRIDAAIAARTHRFWTSDNLDAVSRIGIQRGFLHFMPPERMGAHVGAAPAHATGRTQAMAFRAAVALPGHFGVELDPATLDAADAETLRAAIARYKDLRDRLHQGRL